ncbi:hypothetical protein Tco_0382635 [Tanacetum coccineum]
MLAFGGSFSLQKFVFYEYGIRNMILHTENSFLSLLFIVSEKDWIRRIDPFPLQIGGGCRGKGTQKPNIGGRKAGILDIHGQTMNVRGDRQGVPDALPFLTQDRGGAEGGVYWFCCTWQIPTIGKIKKGVEQHLAKIYTENKSALKAEHWVPNPDDGTYDNAARCSQNAQNWAKSTVVCRQGSRSLAVLRDMQMECSATREYPSLIQTYFNTHTVDGVFLWDKERLLYEEMLRLHALGPTPMMRSWPLFTGGSSGGTFPVLVKKQMDMIMKVVRSDDKMSQLLMQLQSQHDVGSGGGGGDEEDAIEDEDADGYEDS